MRLGTTEIVVIVIIALLIFGPAKLPQLGKAMGKTMGSFKSGLNEAGEEEEEEEEDEEEEKPAKKKSAKKAKEEDEE